VASPNDVGNFASDEASLQQTPALTGKSSHAELKTLKADPIDTSAAKTIPQLLNDTNFAMPAPSTTATPAVFGPVPNREYHEGFMRKAIEMAELALASDETPVGCVFVHDGEVIGRGINGTNASLNVRLQLMMKECTLS